MADHICWGELVGELTHILARAKRMKKFQQDADVYWEVDELSHQQKEWYLDPNNEGFKNFIHDKPYTTKADLYRIRFYGPKIKVDATKPPPPKKKLTLKPLPSGSMKGVMTNRNRKGAEIDDGPPHIHGNPAFTVENVAKKLDEVLTRRVIDVTQEEAANRARIPTAQEQQDIRENGMLGEGTRDHLVIFVRDGGTSTTENVTLSEALHLARHSKDCVAHVVKIVQTLDNRKSPLERARERVHMVLENLTNDGQPDDREMLDLYAAVEAWKQVAGQTAWNVLRPGASQ